MRSKWKSINYVKPSVIEGRICFFKKSGFIPFTSEQLRINVYNGRRFNSMRIRTGMGKYLLGSFLRTRISATLKFKTKK